MAWFEYGTPKRRSLRKNVCLRVRDIPVNITNHILSISKTPIRLAKIIEIKPQKRVLLEFWCNKKFAPLDSDPWTVVYLETDEDPTWICESDVGRGYKGE